MAYLSFQETPLAGLKVVQRAPIEDPRGFFSRLFCREEMRNAGLDMAVVQVNHSLSRKIGTVRGLHFQFPPHMESKFVSCIRGAVFDVAVDIRQGSPTFLQWHGEVLSASNKRSLCVPEGFAHGFQALEPDSEILYLVSASYHPQAEGALNPHDPAVAIRWPLETTEISDKDRNRPHLTAAFVGVKMPGLPREPMPDSFQP